METYTILREFADSWMLLFLFSFFICVIIWVFRPGSSKTYSNIADIPFRHSDAPAPDETGGKPTESTEPTESKEARQ